MQISLLDAHGKPHQIVLPQEQPLDPSSHIVMRGLIDPHVHFRTPGGEHKENWISGAQAAVAGGVTTVFDMPNNDPPCTTRQRLIEKKERIDSQLAAIGIPLRYHLYFGADKTSLDEIPLVSGEVIGVKVFMGSSTGGLLIDDDGALRAAFEAAKAARLPVAVHAEEEATLRRDKNEHPQADHAKYHPYVRSREAAVRATAKAIELAVAVGVRLIVLHIGTKEEIGLVREAKKAGHDIYAETTPHHLFLNDLSYRQLGNYAKMNPPIRSAEDQRALWQGIHDGTVDTIGTDHAPHTHEEKQQHYCCAPSGIPGVETLLPLLLDAYHKKMISLAQIERLCVTNIEKIYSLPANNDRVIVSLSRKKVVSNADLKTLCGWSPYEGWQLQGWPMATLIKDNTYIHFSNENPYVN